MTDKEFEIVYNSLIRLMYKLLYKFHLQNDEDAESEAKIALYRAIETFDSSLELKLSNYAYTCIYNALCYYVKIRKKDIPNYKLTSYEDVREYSESHGDETYERGSTIDYRELVESKLTVEEFKNILSEQEKIIVEELLSDTNKGDITKKLGVSREWYRRLLNRIRFKYIKYFKYNSND